MGKYSTQLFHFSPVSRKKVEADFDGGEVTSNAGALLLRETEAQVGIIYCILNCAVVNFLGFIAFISPLIPLARHCNFIPPMAVFLD